MTVILITKAAICWVSGRRERSGLERGALSIQGALQTRLLSIALYQLSTSNNCLGTLLLSSNVPYFYYLKLLKSNSGQLEQI